MESSEVTQRNIRKAQHYYNRLFGRPEPTDLDCFSWLWQRGMSVQRLLDDLSAVYCPRVKNRPLKQRFKLIDNKLYWMAKVKNSILQKLERIRFHVANAKRAALDQNDVSSVLGAKESLKLLDDLIRDLKNAPVPKRVFVESAEARHRRREATPISIHGRNRQAALAALSADWREDLAMLAKVA
jgi:hypothetical protein